MPFSATNPNQVRFYLTLCNKLIAKGLTAREATKLADETMSKIGNMIDEDTDLTEVELIPIVENKTNTIN